MNLPTGTSDTRVAAIVAALLAAVGWFVLAFLNPFAPPEPSVTTLLVTHAFSPPQMLALRMIVVRLIAAAVGAVGQPVLMAIAFAVGFVPYGLYLVFTPAFFWVGLADVIYLGAAVVVFSDRGTTKVGNR